VSKKAKSVSRIYAVTRKGHGTLRLVKATNWAQALRHVAKDEYTVDVAEQDQLVEAVNRGVKVELVNEAKLPNIVPGAANGPHDDPGTGEKMYGIQNAVNTSVGADATEV